MARMMPKLRFDHVGIAVEDLEAARRRFSKLLGREPSPVEEVPSEGVRLSFFELDGCRLELLEGTSPESPIRRFLAEGGAGVHHLSLRLQGGEIADLLASLSASGVKIAGAGLRPGSAGSRVFFVHPSAADGVLIEFCQESLQARDQEEEGSPRAS